MIDLIGDMQMDFTYEDDYGMKGHGLYREASLDSGLIVKYEKANNAETNKLHCTLTEFNVMDKVKDIILPDAIKNMDEMENTGLPMLYQHNAMETLGKWTNVYVEGELLKGDGRISMAAGRSKEVLGMIADETIKGVSIGFQLDSSKKFSDCVELRNDGGFTFKAIRLYEASIVTIPAHQSAMIEERKSMFEQSKRLRTRKDVDRFEQSVRDQFNF